MLTLGGLGFLFACVFGSYLMSGGSMGPLIEAIPFEMLTIGGAAIGTFVMGNSMHDIKHTLGGFGKIMKGAVFKKADYIELLSLMFFSPGWPAARVRWRWKPTSRIPRRALRSRSFPRSCTPPCGAHDLRLSAHAGHECGRPQPD